MYHLLALFGDWGPGLVRVEALHLLKLIESLETEIILVDDAVVADYERLHAGHAVLGRGGDQGETPDHHTFHYEIHFAERSGGSLSLQNFEEITVVGLGSAGVALFDRASDLFTDGTAPRAVGVLPGQTILLAWGTDNTLGILVHVVPFAWLKGIIMLRFHVAAADLNRVQFVSADAAVDELLTAGLAIKKPLATALHDRHRERPVLVAHEQECAAPVFRIDGDALLLTGLGGEVGSVLPVLREFTAKDN